MGMKTKPWDLPPNLPLLFKAKVAEAPLVNLQASKDAAGTYRFFTYQTVYKDVILMAKALSNIGVTRGANVAFISDNRRQWLVLDLAILSLGARDVPRGCDSMAGEVRFIIDFADCAYAIFENEKQLKKVLDNLGEVPKLKTVILIDGAGKEAEEKAKAAGLSYYTFDALLKKSNKCYGDEREGVDVLATAPIDDAVRHEIEHEMELTKREDVATIIFTSGTTGTPKGVMLTHDNYISQLSVIHDFIYCKEGEWWMTILPVWHSFERLIQYVAILFKMGLAYSKPQAPVLLPDMAAIRPQWICGVPRLWEALYTGVIRLMKKEGGVKLHLFNFFLGIGKAYSKMKDRVCGNLPQIKRRSRFLDFLTGVIPFLFLVIPYKIGDALVFSKIKAKFGGRIELAISGGGALQKEVDDFYRAIGFSLLEGYGMSETAPVISFRDYKHPRPGVVGLIFPTFELRVVSEEHGLIKSMEMLPYGSQGLIVLRGRQVMRGYYKRPDLTKAVIDDDGWLNTGDLGLLTRDGEVKITGRAKDTIVLLDGENVEPAVIEAALLKSDYIDAAVVVGQDKKYLGALIVPNEENVLAFARDNDLIYTDWAQLLKTGEVQSLFASIVTENVSSKNGFRLCEKIYKFALLQKSFEAGVELSAKLEVMRHKIAELYKNEIAGLFE